MPPKDNPEEYAPYIHKTAKADAEKIIRNLKGLHRELKAQSTETESQITVALKLKTQLHLDRLSEKFALSNATMATMTTNVSKLISLGEPEESPTMQLFDSWE